MTNLSVNVYAVSLSISFPWLQSIPTGFHPVCIHHPPTDACSPWTIGFHVWDFITSGGQANRENRPICYTVEVPTDDVVDMSIRESIVPRYG